MLVLYHQSKHFVFTTYGQALKCLLAKRIGKVGISLYEYYSYVSLKNFYEYL
jgi:hypothetical protein